MKYCSKCGMAVNEGDSFCKGCGEKLIVQNDNEQMNNNMQMNNNNMQMNNNGSFNDQNNVQMNGDDANFESLVDVYMGKNAYGLRKGGFSLEMLFFNCLYMLYRKMWLLGLCWFAGVSIVMAFFGKYASFIIFICNIVMAFKIKDIYVKYAREKVRKIVSENPNMNYSQLITLCSAKGGTTLWPVFLIIVIEMIFASIFAYVNKDEITTNSVESYNNSASIS